MATESRCPTTKRVTIEQSLETTKRLDSQAILQVGYEQRTDERTQPAIERMDVLSHGIDVGGECKSGCIVQP
jgi:hypothetical protein